MDKIWDGNLWTTKSDKPEMRYRSIKLLNMVENKSTTNHKYAIMLYYMDGFRRKFTCIISLSINT